MTDRSARRAAGEALANLLATPWRFLLVVALLIVAIGGPAYEQADLLRSLNANYAKQLREGRYVAQVSLQRGTASSTALAPAGISGRRCDALGAYAGVAGAGAFVATGQAVVATEPSGAIPLWRVSPGFQHIVGAPEVGAGVLVGSAAASELGLRTGSRITLRAPLSGLATVAVFAEAGARTSTFDRGIFIVEPPDVVAGDCLVETIGADPNSAATFLAPLLGGLAVTVRGLGDSPGQGADPSADYRRRPSRWHPLLAPVLPVMVWGLLLRMRRQEVVLRRMFGQPRSDAALQHVGEILACLMLACPPAVAAAAAGAWADRAAASAATVALVQSLLVVACRSVPVAVASSIGRGRELRALRGPE